MSAEEQRRWGLLPDRKEWGRKGDTEAGRERPWSDGISGNQKTHRTLLF